ncbi:hypothetical protein niasHT_018525 [Heterodera trifolii]|uniref:Uncharacterized protein n=2 Tax=Heterodera trifolii TaxID=157864 RepID=A0ABD2LB20_9BILA
MFIEKSNGAKKEAAVATPMEKASKKSDETPAKASKPVENKNEQLKKKIENMKKQMDQKFKKILQENIPAFALQLNEIAEQIDNEEKPLEKEFIQKLLDKVRPLYVDAKKDHLHFWSKVRILKNDKHIKEDVTTTEVLDAVEVQIDANYNCINIELEKLHTYHKDRAELERNLQRAQGNKALEEFDQKTLDVLRVNLEETRDFLIVLLTLAEEKMQILLTTSEETKATKNEQMSMYT